MKKIKKMIVVLMAVAMLSSLFAVSTSAAEFNFWIPYPKMGSLQNTSAVKKTTNTTPYVQTTVNTISTRYYLAPSGDRTTPASNSVYLTSPVRRTLSYYSGYGGIGQSYTLCAYPNVEGAYSAYRAKGYWGV